MEEYKQQLPNSTIVLVLGILSIVSCFCYGIIGLILGIIALVISKKDVNLYKHSPEMYTGYENLKAGRICAIVGTSLSAIYFILIVIYFIFVGMMIMPWSDIMNQPY